MEAHELVEKVKNKQVNDDEVIQWCEENLENINLNNAEHVFLYDRAIKIMMQCRINRLTDSEATIMIKYLSQSYLHEKGLDDRIKISVLDKEQFLGKYKSDKVNAMCRVLKGTKFELDYSPNVIEYLKSEDRDKFLDGLRITYHEAAHVLQECSIALPEINGEKVPYTASMFQIAQENVARVADSKFYHENYDNLVLENQANKVRLNKGIFRNSKVCPTAIEIL